MKTQCFYASGDVPRIIDVVDRKKADGTPIGQFSNQTLDELRQMYPTATLGTVEDVTAMQEAALRTDPVQITEEAFWDALECLPPLDWQHKGGGESFKAVERIRGRMTSIYARLGATYWTFTDVDTLPHSEIMARVSAVAKQEAAA